MKRVQKLSVTLLVFLVLSGLATAAPLDVKLIENIKTTVTVNPLTGGGFNVTYTTNITGIINVTNNGSDILFDVWVLVNLMNNATGLQVYRNPYNLNYTIYTDASAIPERIKEYALGDNVTKANVFIHIPVLPAKTWIVFRYDVDDTALEIAEGSPFVVSKTQTPEKIPLKGSWDVILNISMNSTFFSKLSGNQNVSMNFTEYLNNTVDWALLNITSAKVNNTGISLTPILTNSGYFTNAKDTLKIYNIWLNETKTEWVLVNFTVYGMHKGLDSAYAIVDYGVGVVNFTFAPGTANPVPSNSSVVDVFAIGPMNISANKKGPFLNTTSGKYEIWREGANITNVAHGVAYIVYNVSVFATNRATFPDFTHISGSDYWDDTSSLLKPGETKSIGWHNFTFSDVPIVWANVTFELVPWNQTHGWYITNITTSESETAEYGSNFIVIEKIIVINNYFVKVTKRIAYDDELGVYNITLDVENIGTIASPPVYVYDLVPENFTFYNWDDNWADLDDGNWVNLTEMFLENKTIQNPGISGYNYGLMWKLDQLQPGADGDGTASPDEIEAKKAVRIFYQVKGTGDYKALDAFIVGIDPLFSMNKQAAPKITIVGGAKTGSFDILFALLTALVGLGTVLVSRRE